MGGKSVELRQKQERNMRTRWTPALDKIFADLVVEQIQLGNKPNNFFDKKTWNHIREEFNKQTSLDFNNNQLRKHLEVLRTRFLGIKAAPNQNEFAVGESYNVDYKIWDEDFEVQSHHEPNKAKECPIFEQLSTIFAEPIIEGEYARSSHYEELDNSQPNTTHHHLLKNVVDPYATSAQNATNPERKRKLSCVPEQGKRRREHDPSEVMAKAMLDMLNASRLKRDSKQPKRNEKFSISNCVEVLDKIEGEEGMEDGVYFAALDLLEKDANMRETFVSLKSNKIRLAWLLGKCGNNVKASSRV